MQQVADLQTYYDKHAAQCGLTLDNSIRVQLVMERVPEPESKRLSELIGHSCQHLRVPASSALGKRVIVLKDELMKEFNDDEEIVRKKMVLSFPLSVDLSLLLPPSEPLFVLVPNETRQLSLVGKTVCLVLPPLPDLYGGLSLALVRFVDLLPSTYERFHRAW